MHNQPWVGRAYERWFDASSSVGVCWCVRVCVCVGWCVWFVAPFILKRGCLNFLFFLSGRGRYFWKGSFSAAQGTTKKKIFRYVCCVCVVCVVCVVCGVRFKRTNSVGLAGQPNDAWMLPAVLGGGDALPPEHPPPGRPSVCVGRGPRVCVRRTPTSVRWKKYMVKVCNAFEKNPGRFSLTFSSTNIVAIKESHGLGGAVVRVGVREASPPTVSKDDMRRSAKGALGRSLKSQAVDDRNVESLIASNIKIDALKAKIESLESTGWVLKDRLK